MWYYVPSTCAPATEVSSWGCDSPASDVELSLTLSGTHTQRPRSWRGWQTRPWIKLLSGTTSPPSTVDHSATAWISSLRDFPASPSPRPAGEVDLTMTDTSGRWHAGSLLTWDRDSSCWRTSPTLWEPDGFLTSSPILPTSGSMRSGVCSPRPRLALPTSETDSGSWPTPTSMDFKRSGGNPNTTGTHGVTLTDRAVRMWGTPMANDDNKSPEAHLAMKARMGGGRKEATSLTVQTKMWPSPRAHDAYSGGDTASSHPQAGGDGLLTAAAQWPTPQAHDYRTPRDHDSSRQSPDLPDVVSRLAPTTGTDGPSGSPKADLNPRFVEALMAVPQGWATPFTSLATDSFQEWLRQHCWNSHDELEFG